VKLRIRGNSIRLRLRQGEVRRLAAEGLVEERTDFGGRNVLIYSLVADDVPAMTATFDGGRVVVRVPRGVAARWASGDAVGMEGSQPVGAGSLKVLVEKDFECLDAPAGEPQDDAFPNPQRCG
jgi:hypothetical protein